MFGIGRIMWGYQIYCLNFLEMYAQKTNHEINNITKTCIYIFDQDKFLEDL